MTEKEYTITYVVSAESQDDAIAMTKDDIEQPYEIEVDDEDDE